MDRESALETVERISEAVTDVDGVEEVSFRGSNAVLQDDGGGDGEGEGTADDSMLPAHEVLRKYEDRWKEPETGLYNYVVRTPNNEDRRYFIRA
ncbi:MAG: hypothetical protein SXQ77_02335, partial [Halobacteria archaeon]|nr:hypothetical protein [Halobacteria archaeon]